MRAAAGLLPRGGLAGPDAFCLKQCDAAGGWLRPRWPLRSVLHPPNIYTPSPAPPLPLASPPHLPCLATCQPGPPTRPAPPPPRPAPPHRHLRAPVRRGGRLQPAVRGCAAAAAGARAKPLGAGPAAPVLRLRARAAHPQGLPRGLGVPGAPHTRPNREHRGWCECLCVHALVVCVWWWWWWWGGLERAAWGCQERAAGGGGSPASNAAGSLPLQPLPRPAPSTLVPPVPPAGLPGRRWPSGARTRWPRPPSGWWRRLYWTSAMSGLCWWGTPRVSLCVSACLCAACADQSAGVPCAATLGWPIAWQQMHRAAALTLCPAEAAVCAVPLYHPALMWQQLMHDARSRLDSCWHEVRGGAQPRRSAHTHRHATTSCLPASLPLHHPAGCPPRPPHDPSVPALRLPVRYHIVPHAGPAPDAAAVQPHRHEQRPLQAGPALAQVVAVVCAQPQVSGRAAGGGLGVGDGEGPPACLPACHVCSLLPCVPSLF